LFVPLAFNHLLGFALALIFRLWTLGTL
jgi:hypothetical protein